MIDWHCHLLPDLDDGAADLEESVEIARILATVGFREVHCTPHMIKGTYEVSAVAVRDAVISLQRALDEAHIGLHLTTGCEYYLDEFFPDFLDEPLTLGDSRFLLIEFPFTQASLHLVRILAQAKSRGFIPLIAHPERCKALSEDEDSALSLINTMREMGCLFQGDIGSFAGVYGKQVRRRAICFLAKGVYGCLGSDAHRAAHLEGMLRRGLETIEQEVGNEVAAKLLGSLKLGRL